MPSYSIDIYWVHFVGFIFHLKCKLCNIQNDISERVPFKMQLEQNEMKCKNAYAFPAICVQDHSLFFVPSFQFSNQHSKSRSLFLLFFKRNGVCTVWDVIFGRYIFKINIKFSNICMFHQSNQERERKKFKYLA